MSNLWRAGAKIIHPDPDSQYRLIQCKCGYGNVAYTRKITYHGVEWVAGCLTCERCTRIWTTQHAAQIENRRQQYSQRWRQGSLFL